MTGIEIKLDGRFKKEIRGAFGRYQFEVGVLRDSPHRAAKSASAGFSVLAGGPVRKKGRATTTTTAEIGRKIREEHGINYLTAPFKNKKNTDILQFSKAFFQLCLGQGQKKQVENYIQAIIRNPITRGDYGRNTRLTAKIKGFSRLLIDTGQFFKSIVAVTRMRNVQK